MNPQARTCCLPLAFTQARLCFFFITLGRSPSTPAQCPTTSDILENTCHTPTFPCCSADLGNWDSCGKTIRTLTSCHLTYVRLTIKIPTFVTLSSPLTDDWEVADNSFPPSHLTSFKTTMNRRQNSLQQAIIIPSCGDRGNGAPASSSGSGHGVAASSTPQNGPPPLSDVSTGGINSERHPQLLRAALGLRNISRTNEYQAYLPSRRRLDECETDRPEQQAMSDDLTGTGRQPSLGCSAGQEMDGVPISADLRPGGDISVGEPVEAGIR